MKRVLKVIGNIKSKSKAIFKKPIKENISFVPLKNKQISKERIESFWKNYFANKYKDLHVNRGFKNKTSHISSYNHLIKAFPITPTTLVTLRIVSSKSYDIFKSNYNALKIRIEKTNLSYSKIELVDIISSRKKPGSDFYYTMERVFPSVSITDLEFILSYSPLSKERILNKNRFGISFLNAIEKNKINKEKMLNDLNRAFVEFYKSYLAKFCDPSKNNLIVLDYNPKKGVFKFGLIDFAKESISKSH